MRYLELDANGTVRNIIKWDGVSPYNPTNMTLLPHADHPQASYGWQLVDGEWIAPIAEEEE
jgi:hypothetical protein